MPTGYTADVITGKVATFPAFAMQCARAFGALILMRDDPLDAPIPDAFAPSGYYAKRLEENDAEAVRLASLTAEEAEQEAEADYQRAVQHREEAIREAAEARQRCEAMLAQVREWTPPTPDHEGLKRFMVEQLEETIRFDGTFTDGDWWRAERLTGEEWLGRQVENLARDRERHEREWAAEQERTDGRNAWVKNLRESLAEAQARSS